MKAGRCDQTGSSASLSFSTTGSRCWRANSARTEAFPACIGHPVVESPTSERNARLDRSLDRSWTRTTCLPALASLPGSLQAAELADRIGACKKKRIEIEARRGITLGTLTGADSRKPEAPTQPDEDHAPRRYAPAAGRDGQQRRPRCVHPAHALDRIRGEHAGAAIAAEAAAVGKMLGQEKHSRYISMFQIISKYDDCQLKD